MRVLPIVTPRPPTISLAERDAAPAVRCAYCHDGAPRALRCPICATLLHVECARVLASCPSIGCAWEPRRAAPRVRWWLVATIVAIPIAFVAFVSDIDAIVRALASESTSATTFMSLTEPGPSSFPPTLDELARRELGDKLARAEHEATERRQDDALRDLADTLRHARSAQARRDAARELQMLGAGAKPVLGEVVAAAIGDDDAEVRDAAAHAVSFIDADAAAPLLVSALVDHDAQVRYAASDALVVLGPSSTRALVDALEDSGARKPALIVLAKLGPDATFAAPAIRRLLRDDDFNVRELAADALARISGSRYSRF